MSTTTSDDRLTELCAEIRSATVLNALHACRSNHPLGRNNPFKWRNASALIAQQHFVRHDLREWLTRQADAEKDGPVARNQLET